MSGNQGAPQGQGPPGGRGGRGSEVRGHVGGYAGQEHRPVALQVQHFGGAPGNGGPSHWQNTHQVPQQFQQQFNQQYQQPRPPPPGQYSAGWQHHPSPTNGSGGGYGRRNQYQAPYLQQGYQQGYQRAHQQPHQQPHPRVFQPPHHPPYPPSQPPPPPHQNVHPVPRPQRQKRPPPPRPQQNYLSGNALASGPKKNASQNNNRKRKKDIVPPVEPLTEEPVVRAPLNEVERKEIEAWKAERRKHWPTEANVSKKQNESRGGTEADDGRQITLGDVLDTQQRLGLLRKAGTEDLVKQLQRKQVGKTHGDVAHGRGGGEGIPPKKLARGAWSGRGVDQRQQKKERKMTLLERLLEKDIKSFESKVVQLFHFIHVNDFFRDKEKELVFIPAARVGGDAGTGGVRSVDVDITAGEDDDTDGSDGGDGSDGSDGGDGGDGDEEKDGDVGNDGVGEEERNVPEDTNDITGIQSDDEGHEDDDRSEMEGKGE